MAHPPIRVTAAKRPETNLVSHIPAKSSHGAANSRVMRASAHPWESDSPATTSDSAAAITPYIGTCTCVSCISRLVSTSCTSGFAKSAMDMGCSMTMVVSGGIGIDISRPAYVAATRWGVKPAYSETISAPNTYEMPSVASRHVTSHLMRRSARPRSYSMTLPWLEDVHQLHDALRVRALQCAGRIGKERLRRPIGPDGRAQRELRQVKPRVLDVAEDALPRRTEVPHRARGHGPQDLRRSGEEAVTVFHLIVARTEPQGSGEPHEPGEGGAAPCGV